MLCSLDDCFLANFTFCFSGVGVTLAEASLPSTQQSDSPDVSVGPRKTQDVEVLLLSDDDRAQDDNGDHDAIEASSQSSSSPLQKSSTGSSDSSMSISSGDERGNGVEGGQDAEEEDNSARSSFNYLGKAFCSCF